MKIVTVVAILGAVAAWSLVFILNVLEHPLSLHLLVHLIVIPLVGLVWYRCRKSWHSDVKVNGKVYTETVCW